jgi:hypothetical protein
MTFNPHDSRTEDGVVITEGLIVWDLDMRVGKVTVDGDADAYKCCSVRDNKLDGQHHAASQKRIPGVGVFTDHEVGRKVSGEGCYCSHDHWFAIEHTDGTVSRMNGERMATRSLGKAAADVYNAERSVKG